MLICILASLQKCACAPLIDGMGQATPSAIRATYLSCMLSSQATCVILSGFRAALDLNTYPLRNVHGALNGLNLVEVSQCSLCMLAFSLVFTPYLSNAVVSAKSPQCHYFSCPCSTEAVGIPHEPPRSL